MSGPPIIVLVYAQPGLAESSRLANQERGAKLNAASPHTVKTPFSLTTLITSTLSYRQGGMAIDEDDKGFDLQGPWYYVAGNIS